MYLLIITLTILFSTAQAEVFNPLPTDDVLDNPHRGYMLWGSNVFQDGGLPDNFHDANIYHVYLPWRMVETADQIFDWPNVEAKYITPVINAHPEASLVLRLVADYPDGPGSGISAHYSGGDLQRDYPLFLEQAPLAITRNGYSSCNGDGPGVAPDWNDVAFINQVTELVSAFGAYFDGDPRITVVQVGLLGLWGEWHQSGCSSLAPDDTVKNSVKMAYDSAFSITPLQTRYARDPDVVGVDFGFHEDYFPSFTASCVYGFPQCSDSGDWSLEYGLANVVPAARTNWQVSPISGESPLNSQQNTWINDEADVITVINDYHFSFLGPAGKHESAGNNAALDRIANQLGYRFQIDQVTVTNPMNTTVSNIQVDLNNNGSAPVYFPYQVNIDWVNGAGQTVMRSLFTEDLSQLMPGESLVLAGEFLLPENGDYSLRVKATHNSDPVRGITFANQNRDALGRVILGDVSVNVTDLIFIDGFEGL